MSEVGRRIRAMLDDVRKSSRNDSGPEAEGFSCYGVNIVWKACLWKPRVREVVEILRQRTESNTKIQAVCKFHHPAPELSSLLSQWPSCMS